MTLEEAIAILRSPEGRDETRRVHRLHRAVEVAASLIRRRGAGEMTRADAERAVDHVASVAEELFPGSRATFEIVYGRKLRRAIEESFGAGN